MNALFTLLLLAEDHSGQWQVSLALITLIAAAAAVIFDAIKTWNSRFTSCADQLRDTNNEMAQISAAVQLRSYINKRYLLFFSLSREAVNLICSALAHCRPGRFQKALGDSLSFVRHGHGLDLQETTLRSISIKPKNRIQYDITRKKRYNHRSIDLRCADLYEADASESTICNVNFDKAIFYDTILNGTTFHNCSFQGASFYEADVRGVRFYACNLTGAQFYGAKRISEASVYDKEKSEKPTKENLIDFLDEDGVFGAKKTTPVYVEKERNMKVFLSKLGSMSIQQSMDRLAIQKDFESNYNVSFDCIERDKYSVSSPLTIIQDTMSSCGGVIVLAFSHMKVQSGEIRKPKEDKMEVLTDVLCPSPWMQIEAAFARSLGLPCLIIARDNNILRNGIFDESVVDTDRNLFYVRYSNGGFSAEDRRTIEKWIRAVEVDKG